VRSISIDVRQGLAWEDICKGYVRPEVCSSVGRRRGLHGALASRVELFHARFEDHGLGGSWHVHEGSQMENSPNSVTAFQSLDHN
jgi:hypothetical protein